MKNILALSLILILLGSCDKSDSSALIRDLMLNGKNEGAKVSFDNNLSVSFSCEDDILLSDYTIEIIKGGVHESNIVVGQADFLTKRGNTLSGKFHDVLEFISVPRTITPGFYHVKIDVKDDGGNVTSQRQNLSINDNSDLTEIRFDALVGYSQSDEKLYVSRNDRIVLAGEAGSDKDIVKIKFGVYSEQQALLEKEFDVDPSNFIDFRTIDNGEAFSFLVPSNIAFSERLLIAVSAIEASGDAEVRLLPVQIIR